MQVQLKNLMKGKVLERKDVAALSGTLSNGDKWEKKAHIRYVIQCEVMERMGAAVFSFEKPIVMLDYDITRQVAEGDVRFVAFAVIKDNGNKVEWQLQEIRPEAAAKKGG